MTVVDQVSWRQSMQAFVYCHGELVLNPLANWQLMKVTADEEFQGQSSKVKVMFILSNTHRQTHRERET